MNEIFDRLTNKWGSRSFTFELSRDKEHYLDDAEFLQKFRRRGYSVSVEYVQPDHSVIMACKCCPEHNLTNRRVPLSPTQSPVVGSVITSSPGVMFGVERTTDPPRLADVRVPNGVDNVDARRRNFEDMRRAFNEAFVTPAGAPPPQQVNGDIYVRARDVGQYVIPSARDLQRWFERNYPSRRNE